MIKEGTMYDACLDKMISKTSSTFSIPRFFESSGSAYTMRQKVASTGEVWYCSPAQVGTVMGVSMFRKCFLYQMFMWKSLVEKNTGSDGDYGVTLNGEVG